MPRRGTRAFTGLALAASLAALTPSAHAAPRPVEQGIWEGLRAALEDACAWLRPGDSAAARIAWAKAGPAPDPNGAPVPAPATPPDQADAGPAPDPNG